jgi:hypothetical protein
VPLRRRLSFAHPANERGTVPDLLTEIRRDIDRRLDDLRPAVDEFRRLEQARDALRSTNSSRRRPRESRANTGAGRTRMTRAESQEVDRRVLALLAEDSGQKLAALAMLTETSIGGMNSRLRRLVRQGKLKKRKARSGVRYDVGRVAAETVS